MNGWRVRCAQWFLRGTGLVVRPPEPKPIRIECARDGDRVNLIVHGVELFSLSKDLISQGFTYTLTADNPLTERD